jgi:ribosomal protein L2
MPIKFYNPTSPDAARARVIDYKAVLTKFKPEKSLTVGKRRPTAVTITA